MRYGTHRVGTLLASLVFAMPVAANEKAEPDPARSPYWESIRQLMFGDRVINADDRDVIRVYLNLRADDASTVPVAVKSQIDQTENDYIKSIYLIVERNPSPTAGVFHFTPSSGRGNERRKALHVAALGEGGRRLFGAQRQELRAGGVARENEAAFR